MGEGKRKKRREQNLQRSHPSVQMTCPARAAAVSEGQQTVDCTAVSVDYNS